jgi:hypothetical protein
VGLFDFLKRSSSPPPADKGGEARSPDRKVAGHAKVVADRRAQTYDRIESIHALSTMRSPEAAIALLKRFTFTIDPSISDQEEKDLAFQGIVTAGTLERLPKDEAERDEAMRALEGRREEIIEAVQAFCEKAEQLTWPIKVLKALLAEEEYQGELIALLSTFDTEYARNVEPKVQLLQALEEHRSDDVRKAVEPYLDDVNETVRYHAVETTFRQDDPASVGPLLDLLHKEESVRIKNKVAMGLVEKGWAIPSERRDATRMALYDTAGYTLSEDGRVRSR